MRSAPGLRAVAERSGGRIGTAHITTLAYALASPVMHRLSLALLDHLAAGALWGRQDVIVLDSMAISLPATRRHHCTPMNNQTVGGGVLWGLCITARRGVSPLRILSLMDGAWSDAGIIGRVRLAPRGPIHLMDRGFHKIDAMARWMEEGVRFLLRARTKDLVYTQVRSLGGRRELRAKLSTRGARRTAEVLFDGLVVLGSAGRRGERPLLRLLDLRIHRGTRSERLVLLSSETGADAQRLLDLYGRRWEIEEFHRVLKRAIGLAHLYSFRQLGIKTLLALAALLAVLLWLGERAAAGPHARGDSLPRIIRRLLYQARARLGLPPPWRPNIIGKNSWRHRS